MTIYRIKGVLNGVTEIIDTADFFDIDSKMSRLDSLGYEVKIEIIK